MPSESGKIYENKNISNSRANIHEQKKWNTFFFYSTKFKFNIDFRLKQFSVPKFVIIDLAFLQCC